MPFVNKSEVARMREQIDREREAAHRALHAPALGTAHHAFINARMERMAGYIFHLKENGREEEAKAIMCNEEQWDALEKQIEQEMGSEHETGRS
jgi:hypothetical protein